LKRLLLPFGLLALLAGMAAGLARFGWLPFNGLAAAHGPLMVGGFLGGLISLERAAALDRRWGYLPPGLAGLATVCLLVGKPVHAGGLLVAAGVVLSVIHAIFVRRQPVSHAWLMLAAALCWGGGSLVWVLTGTVARAVSLWSCYIVLMIAGERLELSRFARLPQGALLVFLSATGFALAGSVAAVWMPPASRILGLGILGLVAWLWLYDAGLKRRDEDPAGHFRLWSLRLGYVWLTLAALTACWKGIAPAGPDADAFLHSLFLGYAFSMILAHALLIFPALAGLPLKFHRGFWAAFVLLNFSLAIRMIGDFLMNWQVRRVGGLLNVVALLSFLASIPIAARLARR
jgi:hypothetical protein